MTWGKIGEYCTNVQLSGNCEDVKNETDESRSNLRVMAQKMIREREEGERDREREREYVCVCVCVWTTF